MAKNIIIGVLLFLSTVFLIYAFLKANEAEKHRMESIRAMEEAVKNADQARLQAQDSFAAVMAAKAEADSLRKELESCQNN